MKPGGRPCRTRRHSETELVGRELGDLAATFESDFELRDFFTRPSTPATAKRTVATRTLFEPGVRG